VRSLLEILIITVGCNQLPSAEEEAKLLYRTIDEYTKNEKPTLLLGNEATMEAVKKQMETADILHFASHGSKDVIYLSGETKEKGKLTINDVQNLSLNKAKMVVLSACDTFKGDLSTDEVIGITQAFLTAGSSTVIASMWPVGDDSTKEMMKRLYQEIFKDGVDKHDGNLMLGVDVCYALQQVMIGMLESNDYSVRDWAPFLLYGLNTTGL